MTKTDLVNMIDALLVRGHRHFEDQWPAVHPVIEQYKTWRKTFKFSTDVPADARLVKAFRSPYKESAVIDADYTASAPRSEVVLKLTTTKSMTTHKLLLQETETGAVVIHNIETDHGGERKAAHPGLAKIVPFSVEKWYAELHSPIHDGPYFGKLDVGESLYFTVEFLKPSRFTVAVMGPVART